MVRSSQEEFIADPFAHIQEFRVAQNGPARIFGSKSGSKMMILSSDDSSWVSNTLETPDLDLEGVGISAFFTHHRRTFVQQTLANHDSWQLSF